MKILFDIGHPADFYLFLHPQRLLREAGHEPFVLLREKEVNRQLAEAYGIDFIPGSQAGTGMFRELRSWRRAAARAIRDSGAELLVSAGSAAGALAARKCGIPHIVFTDTEIAWQQQLIYRPLCEKIYTPECFLKDFGKKQIRYSGIHEMAYLHPDYFTPNAGIRNELGVADDEPYAILRFVSWGASHDSGKRKTTAQEQLELAEKLAEKHHVFISAESELPKDLEQFRMKIPPHRFHDALAFADIVISDGASTAAEATVLGVKSVFFSPLALGLGYVLFLCKHSQLQNCVSISQTLQTISNSDANVNKALQFYDTANYITDVCKNWKSEKCSLNQK